MTSSLRLQHSRRPILALATLLALSAYGNAAMSQFDAPYGSQPALEAVLHAVGGGLLLYAVIPPLLSPSKRFLTAGLTLLVLGLLTTRTGYNLHTELYGPISYAEYMATSTVFFTIGVLAGILLLPMIPWFAAEFLT